MKGGEKMPSSFPVLGLIVALPLAFLIVLAAVPARSVGAIRTLGLLGSAAPAGLAFYALTRFDLTGGGWQFREGARWFTLWMPSFDVVSHGWQLVPLPIDGTLAVDGLSLPLLFMATFVGFMAALASWTVTHRPKAYWMFVLLLNAGMNGAFAATNLLLFFVFFELTLVALFFLVGIWGGEARERAAYQLLIYNGLGSLIMLAVFLLLFHLTGSFDVSAVAERLGERALPGWLVTGTFLALVVAFGIKLPIVPFHTWVLNVHPVASAPMSMILSGVLLKIGGYGLIRFGVGFFPEEVRRWAPLLAVLGLINLLYGAFLALQEGELKRLIAYSSVSHMGLVLFGLAAANEEGLSGAVFQMVSHGFISALLFLVAGVIAERTGTARLAELGGLWQPMPLASGVLLVGALASLGLPAFSGFVAELLTYLGLFKSGQGVIPVLGAFGLVLSAAYLLRGALTAGWGPVPERAKALTDARPVEVVPMLLLVAAILWIGVYPFVLGEAMKASIGALVARL